MIERLALLHVRECELLLGPLVEIEQRLFADVRDQHHALENVIVCQLERGPLPLPGRLLV